MKSSIKPIKQSNTVSFVEPPLTNIFDKYDQQRIERSYLRDQPEGYKYHTLKQKAIEKMQDLRDKSSLIDERNKRKAELLTKFIMRKELAAALNAIKKWNWAKTMLHGAMKRQREDLREKLIDTSKERQEHI